MPPAPDPARGAPRTQSSSRGQRRRRQLPLFADWAAGPGSRRAWGRRCRGARRAAARARGAGRAQEGAGQAARTSLGAGAEARASLNSRIDKALMRRWPTRPRPRPGPGGGGPPHAASPPPAAPEGTASPTPSGLRPAAHRTRRFPAAPNPQLYPYRPGTSLSFTRLRLPTPSLGPGGPNRVSIPPPPRFLAPSPRPLCPFSVACGPSSGPLLPPSHSSRPPPQLWPRPH